eukprot:13704000-Alexandrium_andersonii.AAC.1
MEARTVARPVPWYSMDSMVNHGKYLAASSGCQRDQVWAAGCVATGLALLPSGRGAAASRIKFRSDSFRFSASHS